MVALSRQSNLTIIIFSSCSNDRYSEKKFKTKINQWGYDKKLRRPQVAAMIQEQRQNGTDLGTNSGIIRLAGRPVDPERIKRYLKRNPIPGFPSRVTGNVIRRDHYRHVWQGFPVPSTQLSDPPTWGIPLMLFHNIEVLIKGSFKLKTWKSQGDELLIESSATATAEKQCIMALINNLELGCTAANLGNETLASSHWQEAFQKIGILAKGQYHGNIPNLIIELNDLAAEGFGPIAALMKQEFARASSTEQGCDQIRSLIFHFLSNLSLDVMSEVEERIMSIFHQQFEHHVGWRSYSTFVMMMDGARRKLLRNKWARLEDCLPRLEDLDAEFDPSNCRPMDVLRMRVEVLYRRALAEQDVRERRQLFGQVEVEASELVRRAEMKENDPWQRPYFFVKGLYHLGSAQYELARDAAAEESFSTALCYEAEFCEVDQSGQFAQEVICMQAKLQYLRGAKTKNNLLLDSELVLPFRT